MTTSSKSQSASLVARAVEEADKCSNIISKLSCGLPRNVRSDYTGRYLLMRLDHREPSSICFTVAVGAQPTPCSGLYTRR